MRLKEQRLWDRFRKHVAPHVRLERIENRASDGMPDVLACFAGVTTFVELKAADAYPARNTTPILGRAGLRQSQKNWFLEWSKAGGRGRILIAVERDLFLIRGVRADAVNDMSRDTIGEPVSWSEVIDDLQGKR